MLSSVLITFVVIFLIVLLAVSAGTKFFESRRKQRMTSMIETAAGQPTVTVATLLKELEPDKPGGLKGLLKSLQFSRHAEMQLQQAGLNWSPSRLIGAMALAAIPGLGLGSLLPILFNGPITAVILAILCALIPYVIVRKKRLARLNSPKPWTSWRVRCAPGTPSPSASKCSAASWPTLLARNSARCSTSRTWVRLWTSLCAISRSGFLCSTPGSSRLQCYCRSRPGVT
jgi:hypothetical protein